MKNIQFIIIFITTLIAIVIVFNYTRSTKHDFDGQNKKVTRSMTLTSSVFKNGEYIPDQYSCNGNNTPPELTIGDIPTSAKSLVLIVDDPDAPGGTFVHWVLFNLPPTLKTIEESSLPKNVGVGVNSMGKATYMGPCPPSGTHHYHFKLYALDITITIHDHPTANALEQQIQSHIVESTELVGLYTHRR